MNDKLVPKTDGELITMLRSGLEPQGATRVVRLSLGGGFSNSAHVAPWFIESCLMEIERKVKQLNVAHLMGDASSAHLNPLEKLGLMVLSDSAHVKIPGL